MQEEIPAEYQQEQAELQDQVDEVNPICLLKNPQEFKAKFFTMTSIAANSFQAGDYQYSIKAYLKSLDMLDLGRAILKEISPHWRAVVYGNLACGYQVVKKLSKCNKFLEKYQEELESYIRSDPKNQAIYLKFGKMLMKSKLQQCAIVSQIDQHEKALTICKSTLPYMEKYVGILLFYTDQLSEITKKQEITPETNKKQTSENVRFSTQVASFAKQILLEIHKCVTEPPKPKERAQFYYWERNPERNEEQVKKKFVSNPELGKCKRSILGVTRNVHWIEQFNIGGIMHITETPLKEFEIVLPVSEYLFKDSLYQIAIYCSLSHFTMATQLRFIELFKIKSDDGNPPQNPKEIPSISKDKHIQKKYGYEQKSQIFRLSEIYHLRAISILAKNINVSVPYLTHIICSYNKHYITKKVLDPIAAICEQSMVSLDNSRERYPEHDPSVYFQSCEQLVFKKRDETVHAPQELLMDSNQLQRGNKSKQLVLGNTQEPIAQDEREAQKSEIHPKEQKGEKTGDIVKGKKMKPSRKKAKSKAKYTSQTKQTFQNFIEMMPKKNLIRESRSIEYLGSSARTDRRMKGKPPKKYEKTHGDLKKK